MNRRRFTWPEIHRHRLRRNRLLDSAPPAKLVDLVAAVGGIQAQVLSAAELAIAIRIREGSVDLVRDALWNRRTLIKTYGPRGTLHLLPARELSLWMAAMRAREAIRGVPWYRSLGYSPAQADSILEAIETALDHACLTREELADRVAAIVGPWAREGLAGSWGHVLAPAARAGMLCFGPSQGSRVTFVRPDQWGAPPETIDPAGALAAVCRRYFETYGPAAKGDVGRWLGLLPDQARRAIAPMAGELEEVEIEGRHAWLLEGTRIERRPEPAPARFLPRYDCYLLGAGPLERIVPPPAKQRVWSFGRGRLEGAVGLSTILVDGVVGGIWRLEPGRAGSRLEAEPFGPVTRAMRQALKADTARVGASLGLDLVLAIGRLD